jgi:hypothetical protein
MDQTYYNGFRFWQYKKIEQTYEELKNKTIEELVEFRNGLAIPEKPGIGIIKYYLNSKNIRINHHISNKLITEKTINKEW